jgi:hypothetical protein
MNNLVLFNVDDERPLVATDLGLKGNTPLAKLEGSVIDALVGSLI